MDTLPQGVSNPETSKACLYCYGREDQLTPNIRCWPDTSFVGTVKGTTVCVCHLLFPLSKQTRIGFMVIAEQLSLVYFTFYRLHRAVGAFWRMNSR